MQLVRVLFSLFLVVMSRAGIADSYIFTDVSIVPMDQERVLHEQSVIIRDGMITYIGPSFTTDVPFDAQEIDGRGLFLIPGLSDMHTHIWDQRDLELFVVNGVTMIRIMSGGPGYLRIRRHINQDKLFGPTVYTAGPFIDGPEPVWPLSDVVSVPAEAEAVVKDQWGRGYDFLKVYDGLSPKAYRAVMEAARKYGMRVIGHVPRRVDIQTALELKQSSIEHLSGYGRALRSFDQHFRALSSSKLSQKEQQRMRYLAVQTKAAGVWNCPTLVVYQRWRKGSAAEELRSQRGIEYVAPSMLAAWQPGKSYVDDFADHEIAAVQAGEHGRKEMVRALHHAGAKLLLGTDTPNPWVVPGYSIYEEMQNLRELGLSPYEVLTVATRNAAEFLNMSDTIGTISAGKRADLVLLDGNPLDDLKNVQRIEGVMLRGKWYPREALAELLNKRQHYLNKTLH